MNKAAKQLIRVLLAVSDGQIHSSIRRLLEKFPEKKYELKWQKSTETAFGSLHSGDFDVCLAEENFLNQNGSQFLSGANSDELRVPVILLTDERDGTLDLTATRANVVGCLAKTKIDAPTLETAISRALRQSEKIEKSVAPPEDKVQFRALVEALPVMIYRAKPFPPYSPTYISPSFEEFGYPLADWLASTDFWMRVLHPEDRERVLSETDTAIKTGGETDFQYRIIGQNGKIHWVQDRGRFIRDEAGNIICWQGIILDITKTRQNQEELQQRRGIHRTLARNIPHTAVILFDLNLRYMIAEVSHFKDLGFTKEKLEDKTLRDIFPEETSREWEAFYRRALGGESVYLERQRGDTYFQVDVVPVRNESGEIFAGMVMFRDITERKQNEKALRESELRYREMFEENQAIKLLIDVATQRIVDANSAACAFYGFSRDEFKAKKISDLNVLSVGKTGVQTGKVKNGERDYFIVQHRLASGELRDVEVHSSPIDNQKILYSIVHDITDRKHAETALKESEERYRDLFENANDLIYTHDFEGNFISVNRMAKQVFGFTFEEARRMNIREIIVPEHLETAAGMLAAKIAGAEHSAYEIDCLNRQGERITLEINSRSICREGVPYAVQGVARDVTKRRQMETALKSSEEKYRELFENANDLIYTHDLQGVFTSLNRAGEIITGYSREEAFGMNISQVVAPEYLELAYKMIDRKVNDALPTTYELEIISKQGNRVSLELSTRLIYQDNQPVFVQGLARDISERRTAEAKLKHHALHDPLTTLPNRVSFMNHLTWATTRKKTDSDFQFAVLFLDLDRFKIINDSLGHLIGDKLLVAIARRLEFCVRPKDVVARLGGDEFTILLWDIKDADVPVQIANRLLESLTIPFELDGYEVFTSASIGIIISDEINRQPEDFLRDADTAMYRAKAAGKARCEIFDREMHIRNMNLLQLENDLRRAIEQKEFKIYYQPIIHLETGEIHEFEALIRWQHPTQGLVMPDEFISIAEETGLIIPIGEWVLHEACRQTVEWQKLSPNAARLCVSVNLSAKQMMHPKLSEQVGSALAQSGLNPLCLKLEVTESVVMENDEKALDVISKLRSLSVEFSTDDFGTGYSSLSYLHRFPFDRLKVDRSFVGKMDNDEKSEAIVRTILLLGQNLNIEVVAEGIETGSHLELLQILGCEYGQGHLFSTPVSAETVPKFLENALRKAQSDATTSYEMPPAPPPLEFDKTH